MSAANRLAAIGPLASLTDDQILRVLSYVCGEVLDGTNSAPPTVNGLWDATVAEGYSRLDQRQAMAIIIHGLSRQFSAQFANQYGHQTIEDLQAATELIDGRIYIISETASNSMAHYRYEADSEVTADDSTVHELDTLPGRLIKID